MAKQDDYIRFTLRIPPELHRDLTELAGVKSMNAFILESLDEMVRIAKSRMAAANEEAQWNDRYEISSVLDLDIAKRVVTDFDDIANMFKDVLEKAGVSLVIDLDKRRRDKAQTAGDPKSEDEPKG